MCMVVHKMPLRVKKSGCWGKRSRLELILIAVILTAILIAVVLLVLVIKKSHSKEEELSSDVCLSTTCIHEAAKILQRIDHNANPCEDFYQFACANFLKTSHGDEKLNDFFQMRETRNRQLLEMYAEGIRDDEHKLVKGTKNLFRACMNKSEIAGDDLKSIKISLEEIGGWPVLFKGSNWSAANFDWVKATYKLRELGYPFTTFLNLDVQEDVENKGKYVFKVEVSNLYDDSLLNRYSKEQAVGIMTEIAMQFGAEDRQFAYKQMDGTYRFWKYLQSNGVGGNGSRMTISDFQKKYGNTFNWLNFIRNITGPTADVSNNDNIYFQNPGVLRSWLDLISTTPKRTLANYMLWKVIEGQLPYLAANIRNLDNKREDHNTRAETRAEFCLNEIQKRFTISPIEIMYSRKYLPIEKRKQAAEILEDIKSEFVNLLKNSDWMEERDKQVTVAKAEAIGLVVGQPGNYFDDKMLDALDVDMVTTKTETFLNLLAQANRNHQSSLYNQIKMKTHENLLNNLIKKALVTPVYNRDSNIVFVPVIVIQGFPFQETRLGYLNYGSLGRVFAGLLSQFIHPFASVDVESEKWSNETVQTAEKMGQCLTKNMEACKLHETMLEVPFAVSLGLGEKISYAAYEKWSKINGEERKLFGIDYIPRQLFWISSTYCYTTNMYSDTYKMYHNNLMFLGRVTCGAMSNNLDFAKDFGCPAGSAMNPVTKCTLW